jgi:hypothetical protein
MAWIPNDMVPKWWVPLDGPQQLGFDHWTGQMEAISGPVGVATRLDADVTATLGVQDVGHPDINQPVAGDPLPQRVGKLATAARSKIAALFDRLTGVGKNDAATQNADAPPGGWYG